MSIAEQARHQLYNDLATAIGSESAGNLMSYLPPVGWADVATKRDLDQLGESLRGEVRTEIASIRGQFGELRGEFGELRGEFGELRGEFGELRGEFGELRGEFGELRAELHRDLNAQTKTLVFAVASLILTVAALGFAAIQLTA